MGRPWSPARGRQLSAPVVRIGPLSSTDLEEARGLAVLAEVTVGTPAAWAAELRSPTHVLLGAWTDDALVGIATGSIAVDDADVLLVVVEPRQRRRGIGRGLTLALSRALCALGAERVLLEVRAHNTAALAMYTDLGFVEVARRRSYYVDGQDALVLARTPQPGDLAATGGRP